MKIDKIEVLKTLKTLKDSNVVSNILYERILWNLENDVNLELTNNEYEIVNINEFSKNTEKVEEIKTSTTNNTNVINNSIKNEIINKENEKMNDLVSNANLSININANNVLDEMYNKINNFVNTVCEQTKQFKISNKSKNSTPNSLNFNFNIVKEENTGWKISLESKYISLPLQELKKELFNTKIKLQKNESRKYGDMKAIYQKNLNEQEIILKILAQNDPMYKKDYDNACFQNKKFNTPFAKPFKR